MLYHSNSFFRAPFLEVDDAGVLNSLHSCIRPALTRMGFPEMDYGPRGQVSQFRFSSQLLQNERDVWIYTPPGYDPTQGPYSWLLLNDGGAYVALPTPTILGNLQAAGRIPPVVAIFVGIVPGVRNRELGCNETFLAFLCEELLPWVRERYAITSDPHQAAIGGVSAGGLMASI